MKDAALDHVDVLENEMLIINGVRILGTTARTDFTSSDDQIAACKMAKEWMNDFRYIRIDTNYRRLRPYDLVTRNHAARAWLTDSLTKNLKAKRSSLPTMLQRHPWPE